jgi:hypothetical protein
LLTLWMTAQLSRPQGVLLLHVSTVRVLLPPVLLQHHPLLLPP